MPMTLPELHVQRDRLATTIREMARNHASWTDTDRQKWEVTNSSYDDVQRQIVDMGATTNSTPTPYPNSHLIGRDGGRLRTYNLSADDLRGGNVVNAVNDLDLSLAGWLRNSHGHPVPMNEFEACARLGCHPSSSGIEIPLTSGRPGPFALSTVDGSSGGYTIPSSFIARLEKSMADTSGMLTASEVMVTSDGREMLWPMLDDATSEGSRIGESTEAATDTTLSFRAKVFRNYKYSSGLLKAPTELIRDSGVPIAAEIGRALGERLGRSINRSATEGTGAAGPTGILTDAVVGSTAAGATAITMDELITLRHSVDPVYRVGAVFMMSDSVASYVSKLKNGEGDYMWQPSTQEGQPNRLLGHAVVVNNHMATSIVSGAKTVLFGSLKMFKIRLVGAVRFRSLTERFATSDEVGFLSFMEMDSGLLRPSSSATLCPVKYLLQP